MEYISVSQFAEQHNLSERTVRNWCAAGKMEGAVLVGKTWNVPADAPLPRKGKQKESPLLQRLREEKEGKISGGIYHRTQIDLTYKSNHLLLPKNSNCSIAEVFENGATSTAISQTPVSPRKTTTKPCLITSR